MTTSGPFALLALCVLTAACSTSPGVDRDAAPIADVGAATDASMNVVADVPSTDAHDAAPTDDTAPTDDAAIDAGWEGPPIPTGSLPDESACAAVRAEIARRRTAAQREEARLFVERVRREVPHAPIPIEQLVDLARPAPGQGLPADPAEALDVARTARMVLCDEATLEVVTLRYVGLHPEVAR